MQRVDLQKHQKGSLVMQKKDRLTGIALAAAAAALFATTPLTVQAGAHAGGGDAPQGKCEGGNACKGQSACATASSSCKGQNACKGQGHTQTTKAECEAAGGEFESA
jgi:uncharacterized membrane protein